MNHVTRPRAIVPTPTIHDVSSASEYGTLTHLFGPRSALPPVYSEEYRDVVSNELRGIGYDPDHDYLVVSGSVTNLAITIAEIARTYGRLRLLCFDARLDKYVQVDIGPHATVA